MRSAIEIDRRSRPREVRVDSSDACEPSSLVAGDIDIEHPFSPCFLRYGTSPATRVGSAADPQDDPAAHKAALELHVSLADSGKRQNGPDNGTDLPLVDELRDAGKLGAVWLRDHRQNS